MDQNLYVDAYMEDLVRGHWSLAFVTGPRREGIRAALGKLGEEDYATFYIDASDALKAPDLLGKFSDAVSAPSRADNSNALQDWLFDLSWMDYKRGYFFVLESAQQLWTNDPGLAGELSEVFQSLTHYWAREAVPFRLIFEMEGGAALAAVQAELSSPEPGGMFHVSWVPAGEASPRVTDGGRTAGTPPDDELQS